MTNQNDLALSITENIREFTRSSPLNHLSLLGNGVIFDEPIVQFADGDDPIFTEYKTIIDTRHLTPREVLALAFNQSPQEVAERISVISWILPITAKTRMSNRRQKTKPSRLWSDTRIYGEPFNDSLREYVLNLLNDMGYRAVAPMLAPFFDSTLRNDKGRFSNWSERHAAYAAGLGTFSLSDGFITERGIAHRCGSVVTDLALPPSPRQASDPYANCLFYADGSCSACIQRCPAGAITEAGHDKHKCEEYIDVHIKSNLKYNMRGCGLCQTKVPCEFRIPRKKPRKKITE
ncbi:epoxyqueuosine reductase [Chloroflexota bacterium]